jgi:hypothetical protein
MATNIPPHNLGEVIDACQATGRKGKTLAMNAEHEAETRTPANDSSPEPEAGTGTQPRLKM